jgi:copper chaperone CopZ
MPGFGLPAHQAGGALWLGHSKKLSHWRLRMPRSAHPEFDPDDSAEEVMNAHLSLALSGMTCHACARLIEEELRETPGVERAEVNFEQRQAAVEFDDSRVTAADLIKRISDLGYQAALS